MTAYIAQCGDDEMIATIRSCGNRAHTVQVWRDMQHRHLSRASVLRRLKYLEAHDRVRRVETVYKTAFVWGAP